MTSKGNVHLKGIPPTAAPEKMASPELGNARTDFSTAAVRTLAVLRELAGRYQEMVVKDPEFTSKIETVLRLASYVIPGALQIES